MEFEKALSLMKEGTFMKREVWPDTIKVFVQYPC